MRNILYAVVGVMLGTSTVSAATTAVENVLDPVLHPYQASGFNDCSTANTSCQISFPVVTAERVLILHASCSFNLSSGVSVTNVFIVGSLDTSATNSLAPFVFGTNGGSTFYGINAETYLFLSKNETPALEVQMIVGAPVRFLKCTLSGYHL